MNYDFYENIKNGTLHHAFIIEGPYNADKRAYANKLAQAVLCKEMPGKGCGECTTCRKIKDGNHLDVMLIEPMNKKGTKTKSIKDEQIEELQERLLKKPFESDRNIAVIDGADTVTPRAFNRLLKTLEEPPLGTVIFLLSENAENLPQTIRSRCIHVRVYGDEKSQGELKGKKEAEELIMLIADEEFFYKIKQLVEGFVKDREKAYILLDAMEQVYMDMLFRRNENYIRFNADSIYRAVSLVEEARREIQRNANAVYAIKKMALSIGG